MEHLCDTLCYQLDLASFVACVNSGQSWNSKFSLMLSGKGQIAFGSEDAQSDSFVENFVLERLSFQSPLRVRRRYFIDLKRLCILNCLFTWVGGVITYLTQFLCSVGMLNFDRIYFL